MNTSPHPRPRQPARSAAGHGVSLGAIPWEPANADGTRSALLHGTRDPGETFVYAFFIPAGVWDQPHSHIADAHIVVAAGELKLGYGQVLDRPAATAHPAGSFLYVPAHATHYDGADTDTIIIGTATGPWSTDYMAPNE